MAWILDQTKKLSINSDNCNYIYVETKTNTIKAVVKSEVNGNDVKLAIGTYDSPDICIDILNVLNSHLRRCDFIEMPIDSEHVNFIEEHRTFGS